MIRSFADPETEKIWRGERIRKLPPEIQQRAFIRPQMIEAADMLDDLHNPQSNRLHALDRDRTGQHPISINMQWRICFVWKDDDAHDVEITDYH